MCTAMLPLMLFFNVQRHVFIRLLFTTVDFTEDYFRTGYRQFETFTTHVFNIQNRLEHTIDNLDNIVENTTTAESRIRDTDMAEEMVEYSKNNILAQAGQSMLAQANQSTQGVLSLLQ